MLFGGNTGHRLKPVGKMGGALFNGPILHGVGNSVCQAHIQRGAIVNGFFQSLVNFLRQALFHGSVIKHGAAENFCYGRHKGFLQSIIERG